MRSSVLRDHGIEAPSQQSKRRVLGQKRSHSSKNKDSLNNTSSINTMNSTTSSKT